jgi:hypothetical protein
MGFTQLLMLSNGCEGKLRADLDRIYGEMKRVAKGVERLHAFALTLQSRCIAAGEDGVGDARPPSEPPSP